ncbi:MAG: hypothetical protein NVS4B9_38870 [Ktedonobacteraceae bacterium]
MKNLLFLLSMQRNVTMTMIALSLANVCTRSLGKYHWPNLSILGMAFCLYLVFMLWLCRRTYRHAVALDAPVHGWLFVAVNLLLTLSMSGWFLYSIYLTYIH